MPGGDIIPPGSQHVYVKKITIRSSDQVLDISFHRTILFRYIGEMKHPHFPMLYMILFKEELKTWILH